MIDWARALIFPAPKPLAPRLSKTSKKNVSCFGPKTGFVNTCTKKEGLFCCCFCWSKSASVSNNRPSLAHCFISSPASIISLTLDS